MKPSKKDYLHYLKVKFYNGEMFEHYGSEVRIIGISSWGGAFGETEYKFDLSCGSTICLRFNKGEKE